MYYPLPSELNPMAQEMWTRTGPCLTYSTDAKHAASSGDKFIRLIDGDEFIVMWQEYYDKMSDEDKNMLPLKRIAFLGNNE